MRRAISKFIVSLLLIQPAYAQLQEPFLVPWETSDQRLLAGLKIATKQNSSSSQQTQQMLKDAKQAAHATLQQQWLNLEVAKAQERTGYTTGNGIGACSVAEGRKSYRSGQSAQTMARSAFTAADNSWLTSGGDGAERLGASLGMRRDYFCSVAENAAGVCNRALNAGAFEAGDSNAAVWMMRRNMGGEEVAVGAMFLDVIAPLPTINPNLKNAEQGLALLEARHEGALMSGARSAIMNVIIDGMGGDL